MSFQRWLGCDPLVDGLQQNNRAPVLAALGTSVGMLAINVGANIGSGDTIASTRY